MSIALKSAREVELMRVAGQIVANTLQELRAAAEPGMTTKDLDRLAERSIRDQGGEPAFPHINDFPGSACISVNNEVLHGIPGRRRLREGDLVKIDAGAIYQGYHGDAAVTVPIGSVSDEALHLLQVTERCLALGIAAAQPDGHLFDIGGAIQDYAEAEGFSVVRHYVGHGIGRELHEDPNVPHYRQASRGLRLRPGMTFTVEPMVNAGTPDTRTLRDGWTVVTADGQLSAQFEHTVLVGEAEPDILTIPQHGEPWGIPTRVSNSVY